MGRYLPDPSLRYSSVAFAGPGLGQLLWKALLFVACVGAVLVPLFQLIFQHSFGLTTGLIVIGALLGLEVWGPLRHDWRELRDRAYFWRHFRVLDLGLERAVPQAGTSLRYEVHLGVRRAVSLQNLQIRLVFWESWRAQSHLKWLRLPHRVIEKQGHDLVRQELGALQLEKGQHLVIRGALLVPRVRPTEHHRGKPKYLSYVNVTSTMVAQAPAPLPEYRGNCPHLITFPWM